MMFFMAPAAQGIMADPDGNLCQPVFKRGLTAKRRQMIVHLDKYVLADVIQFIGVTGKTSGEGEHSPLVPAYQSRKGPVIAPTRSLHQAFIGRFLLAEIHEYR